MRHMIVDQTGVVWLTDNSNGSLHRLASGEWERTGAGSGLNAVAVNPADAKAVYAIQNGALVISNDGGVRRSGPTRFSRVATDIPWLQTTNEDYMSAADIVFDPSQSNVLIFRRGRRHMAHESADARQVGHMDLAKRRHRTTRRQ